MSHKRNAARFAAAIFWAAVGGLAYTAVANSGNSLALYWATWLLYAAIAVVVVYAGFYTTKHLWSIK